MSSPNTDSGTIPDTLRRAVKADRLASAYLWYGRPPIEFRSSVLAFLKALVCTESADELTSCGTCRDCVQAGNLTHPDVNAPGAPGSSGDEDPDGRFGVDAVRNRVLEPASLTSARGPRTIFWLHDMDRFTPEASNTLLKVLEEPPGETVFLLTTRSRWDCLPTVRSRCQWIRVAPGTDDDTTFFEACRNRLDPEPEEERMEEWLALLNGESRSDRFDWSRDDTRTFLGFLIMVINELYGRERFDASEWPQLEERLSYRLIPDILQRLNELERGGNPSLIVNSLLEEIFYPEEKPEWAHVT